MSFLSPTLMSYPRTDPSVLSGLAGFTPKPSEPSTEDSSSLLRLDPWSPSKETRFFSLPSSTSSLHCSIAGPSRISTSTTLSSFFLPPFAPSLLRSR